MVATECVATGADLMAGATTRGRMMWRILHREGQNGATKTAIGPAVRILARNGLRNDPYANHSGYQQGGGRRIDRYPNRGHRCVAGSLSDGGGQAISRFMPRFARRQQGTGRTNCRLADVLSGVARARRGGVHGQQCDISGILLRAVSGCCYNNDGLRNRRRANAITKHGGKGEWQTSVQTLPFPNSAMAVATTNLVKNSICW